LGDLLIHLKRVFELWDREVLALLLTGTLENQKKICRNFLLLTRTRREAKLRCSVSLSEMDRVAVLASPLWTGSAISDREALSFLVVC
jgi:hypothetical protein